MKGLIFTYVLTYGGAFAALFNPYVGLLVYVCFAILKPESLWYWEAGSMPANSSRIVAIALLLGWVFRAFGNWKLGKAWSVLLALLAFLGWTVLSWMQCYHQDWAWGYVEELVKIVLPFVVGVTTIESAKQIRTLAWAIVLSQGYVAFELNMAYLGGFNRVSDIGFGGMDNNCVGIAMNTGIGLAVFLGFSASRWYFKALGFAMAACMSHVVLLTFSRGGMLGLLTTGAIIFFLLKKTTWHYLLFVLAGLLFLRFSGPEVVERFLSTFASAEVRDLSAEGRIKLWRDCLDIMIKNPVFGIGPRHFPLVAPSYGWPFGKEAHTLWLQVGAEQGAMGLALLVSFYGLLCVQLWWLIRKKDSLLDPELRPLAGMVIASLVGFAVSAQFVSLVGLELPYYVGLLGAGVLKLASYPPKVNPWEMVEDHELILARAPAVGWGDPEQYSVPSRIGTP